MKKLFGLLRFFQKELVIAAISFFNRKTPMKLKCVMGIAMLYLISPIDVVPDIIPFAGVIDDAVVVPAVFGAALGLLPDPVRADSEAKAALITKRAPWIFAAAAIVIFLWIAIVIWAFYTLLIK